MSEFATRTTTSPGSSSSSERSTNSARIFLSGVSVSWYALNLSTGPPALALQIIGRLHLVEAAHGAGELRGPLGVERLGLRLGRYDELDPFIVEHIDQPGEAPRGVSIARRHFRHARQDHAVEAPGELDIVGIGARPAAQHREIEPHQAAGAPAVGNAAPFHVQGVLFLLDVPQFGKDALQLRLAARAGVIDLEPLHLAAPVIQPAVDLDQVEPALDQPDRRQEPVALQTVLVEPVGVVVARHAEHDAVLHHLLQVAAEDHRVGDVRDVKLVEADQPAAPGGALGERGDRILGAFQSVELAMDLAHEVVEVDAALAYQRHAQVEAVHEEALAPPDGAPQVDPFRQRRPDQQALQPGVAPRLVGGPLLVQLLQPLDRAPLRRVRDEPTARETLLVERDDILHQPFSERLSTASAASRVTSDIDGCAWLMRAMSSDEAPNSIATTASVISSLARPPIECTPRMRSVLASARILTKPSGSSRPSARPL